MNNQGKNVALPSFFGHSGSGASSQPFQYDTLSHTARIFSQSRPQTQFPGFFQFSQAQNQAQAQAQAQYAQAQVQAQYAQVQAQAQYAQAQALLQSEAARTHSQSQTQPIPFLHNLNTNVPSVTSALASGSAKRTAQKPPLWPPGSSNSSQSPLFKTTELTPAARQQKREFLEKQVREKVAAILPESAFITQLLEWEAKIDSGLDVYKIDIQDTIRCPPPVQKTLRIYLFNTFTKIDSEDKNATESSWSLKITGRVVENGNDPVSGNLQNIHRSSPSYPMFSAFFKKVTIYLDQSLYPDDDVIVWENARSPHQQDGFEVKRKGNQEFTAKIEIEMNYSPQKFIVSPQLSKLLGVEFETRPRIMAALWRYVKTRKLQNQNDPSLFMCDPFLQRVFGEEKMEFSVAAKKLLQHLSLPQPIRLEHNIKLSGQSPAGIECFDVQVDVPCTLDKDMATFLANSSTETQKEIEAYDVMISASFRKIQEHSRRRAFFLSFSQSPAEFIHTSIASQGKNLKLAAGGACHNAEKELHSKFYGQPWVEDAVIRYLNRKAAGSDGHGGN